MEKTYKEPKFTLVGNDYRNRVFFTASGDVPGPNLEKLTRTTSGW